MLQVRIIDASSGEWLVDTPTGPVLPLTREETNRYVYMCDLLYGFILQHHFRSHFYVMSSNIVVRVATLLKARDKHLQHGEYGSVSGVFALDKIHSCFPDISIIVEAEQCQYERTDYETRRIKAHSRPDDPRITARQSPQLLMSRVLREDAQGQYLYDVLFLVRQPNLRCMTSHPHALFLG